MVPFQKVFKDFNPMYSSGSHDNQKKQSNGNRLKQSGTYLCIPFKCHLSCDVASGSKITPGNKINKPQVVYRFSGSDMTFIITLRT